MTRQQRRSKSQLHNRMKRRGFVWRQRGCWKPFRWAFTIAVEDDE